MKAIYPCSADHPDELTFYEGEVIVVEGEEDSEWWVSQFCRVTTSPMTSGGRAQLSSLCFSLGTLRMSRADVDYFLSPSSTSSQTDVSHCQRCQKTRGVALF